MAKLSEHFVVPPLNFCFHNSTNILVSSPEVERKACKCHTQQRIERMHWIYFVISLLPIISSRLLRSGKEDNVGYSDFPNLIKAQSLMTEFFRATKMTSSSAWFSKCKICKGPKIDPSSEARNHIESIVLIRTTPR